METLAWFAGGALLVYGGVTLLWVIVLCGLKVWHDHTLTAKDARGFFSLSAKWGAGLILAVIFILALRSNRQSTTDPTD